MGPESPLISVLSIFSLALLKDYGVYNVDLSQAEEFFWGKNAGCNFVSYFCDGKSSFKYFLIISQYQRNKEKVNN
jgi:hypothetical protein